MKYLGFNCDKTLCFLFSYSFREIAEGKKFDITLDKMKKKSPLWGKLVSWDELHLCQKSKL